MIVNVPISDTWLVNLLNPSDYLRASKQDRQESDGITGQVVSYAGRSVAESSTERTRSTPLVLLMLSDADVAKLRAWWLAGTPLLLLDRKWRRTGVVFTGDIDDQLAADAAGENGTQVTVTFYDIDYDEGV